MSSGQKAAFSFLTALILFAGFVFFAQTGLMSQIETRFYKQAKIAEKQQQLDKLSQSCNSYISNILTLLDSDEDSYLKSPAVQSYADLSPSEKYEEERKRLTVELFDKLPGLENIRLIENNGVNLQYSTIDSDILKQDGIKKIYKKYSDIQKNAGEYDSQVLMVDSSSLAPKILLDSNTKHLIISLPLNLKFTGNFGTFVFYFNLKGFEQSLLNDGAISLGQTITIYSDENYSGGFVVDVPSGGINQFSSQIWNNWKNKNRSVLEPVAISDEGTTYCLMTSEVQAGNFKISEVFNKTDFELPVEFVYLIYICVFTTLLLITSLLFNLKRDYVSVIKARIKKVQFGIINEYLENREQIEWEQIAKQLDDRKQELSSEIKKSIGGKSKKYGKQVDAYLDASWAEIIDVLGAKNKKEQKEQPQPNNLSGASIEEIRKVIEEVLANAKLNVAISPDAVNVVAPFNENELDVEPVEEIENVEEIAGPIEEIESVDEVEPVEEIEAVEEVAEPVEEIEAVEEVEPVEEIEVVEEVAEPVDEIDTVEEVEPVEEIEAVEEITEPVDEIDTVEEVEPVEEIEAVEEIAEPVEEISTVDEAESEPLEELEEIDISAEEQPVPVGMFINEFVEPEAEAREKILDAVELAPGESADNAVDAEEVKTTEEAAAAEKIKAEKAEAENITEAAEIAEEIKVLEENNELDEAVELEELDELEELEELPEMEEASETDISKEQPAQQIEDIVQEVEQNVTFSSSENDEFANVDDVFAEDLCIGPVYTPSYTSFGKDFKFVACKLDFISTFINEEISVKQNVSESDKSSAAENNNNTTEPEELLEAEELLSVDNKNNYFSMTQFAQNDGMQIDDLEEAEPLESESALKNNDKTSEESSETIVENDGVYSVASNLKFTDVVQDPAFKALVDSVLR